MGNPMQSLKNQLEAKRQDMRRLQAQHHHLAGTIEGLESAIKTLEQAEKKHARQASSVIPVTISLNHMFPDSKKLNLEDLAYAALKEAGKPVSGDEIVQRMTAQGCTSSKQSILGAVYRSIKVGKGPFVKLDRGMFALNAWRLDDDEVDESIEERAVPGSG